MGHVLAGTDRANLQARPAVTALAFDPDGRVLAIGGDDGTIRLEKVPQQKALGFPLRVNDPVQSLTFRRTAGDS